MLALALSAAALAAGPTTLTGEGRNIGALDGVVVWEAPRDSGSVLMRRAGGRIARIRGVRPGTWTGNLDSYGTFLSLDLGRDASGRIIATYQRCAEFGRCRGPFVADVMRGGERRLALAVPRRCRAAGSAARWRSWTAYPMACPGAGRSGLYVSGRLAIPIAARSLASVKFDLAGSLLAALSPSGVHVARHGRTACRAKAASPGGWDSAGIDATPGAVWWGLSSAGAYGGNVTSYGSASIAPDCAVQPRDVPGLDALEDLDSHVGTFATDGSSVFLAGERLRESPLGR